MNSLIQKQMIFWTFGLVALFGVLVVVFLLEPPKSRASYKSARSGRMPAAILEGSEQVTEFSSVAQMSDYKVNCDEKIRANFEKNVHQVRLLGETCKPKINLKNAQISNLTNGFVATVFVPDQRKYATDYISLVKGENRISLELQYSDGSSNTRELFFLRK